MKTRIGLLAILFIAFAFNSQAQKYTFQYNFNKGDTFIQTSVSNMKLSQERMGQTVDTKSTVKYRYKVADIQNDLIFMTMSYEFMNMEMDGMGQKMTINSDNSNDNPVFADFSKVFNSIKENEIAFVMSKRGEIKEINGIEEIRQAIINSGVDANNPLTSQLMQQFSKNTLMTLFEQLSSHFPDNPVEIGEMWERDLSIHQSSINMDAKTKITFLSMEDDIATLKVETELGSEDKVYKQEMNGMEINTILFGSQNGIMKVDLRTGWIQENSTTQNMKSESEMMGMVIPQTIISETVIRSAQSN